MAITLDSLRSDFHNIAIKSESGTELSIDGSGYLTITNTSFAVTATDLDIRDLASSQDNVEIKTAAGQALSIDGSGFLTISNTSFAVTATDLDIRDLAFATDSVTAHQGGAWSFTLDNISTWKNTVETASTTVGEIVATPLTNRSRMTIQNLGTKDCYLGPDNSVTVANGQFLPKGSSVERAFDDGANVWVITDSGTADLRVSEYAA